MIVLSKCALGLYLILQSLSGTFSLITLFVMAYVTLKQPSIGGMALSGFCAVIPAILCYAEHRETLATMNADAQAPTPPSIPTIVTTVDTAIGNIRGTL